MPSFLSAETEPLRRYIYSVAVAILGLLVLLGVVTDDLAFAVGGVLAVALVVPAVEVARSKVDSPETSVAKDEALVEAEAALESAEYQPRHLAG